ncbi:MAG: HAD-IA family hydrolase [Candidatus Eisenbacteria bacterium]|nr:HAD-IA family hydrolase [Candidatus Eisenbacteria bacterium]
MSGPRRRPEFPLEFLLFDLDGTLLDTLPDIAGSVNHTLRRLGRPTLSVPMIRSYVGRGLEVLLVRSLGDGDAELLEEAARIFRAHYDDHCLDFSRPRPGARELLDRFADRPMAVVSNKPERFIHRLLEAFDMDRRMSAVFGGDSVPEKKPSPLMVLLALERFGAAPDRGILVGDMPVDVETGRAAGVYTVAVTGGFAEREELEASAPDLLLEGLTDIPGLFH